MEPHKTFAEKVSEVADEIIAPLVEPVVINYLGANPPVGGLTIDQIKADSNIADSLNKKHASGSDNQDLSNLVVKVTGSSLVPNTEIAKIHISGSDNQDLSGLQPKETGKGLSTNDYTTAEQTKLTGIQAGANNYTHPANHPASIITQDVSNRFVNDTEKGIWNGKEPGNSNIQTHISSAHAPSNAQKNSDITKAEIEAQLIGEISTHTHAGGGGGLNQQQIMRLI
jgi:hypothetical protein